VSKNAIRALIRETLLNESDIFDRPSDYVDDSPSEVGDAAVKLPFPKIVLMPELLRRGAKIVDVAGLLNGEVINVMTCSEKHCSEWAANIIDPSFFGISLGNAWHAHNAGKPLRFSAYSDVKKYASDAAEILKAMNAEPDKIYGEPFKEITRALGESLADDFDLQTNVRKLQLGDVVGMFHRNSVHYPDAFFEGATDYNLATEQPLGNTGPAFYSLATGVRWTDDMMGQNKNFVVDKPFGMNTHLGLVGGMCNNEPIIFHATSGKVKARLAKFMEGDADDKIVWAKPPPDV